MPEQEEIFEEEATEITEEDGEVMEETETIDLREEYGAVKGTAGGEGGTTG